ncbi:MAG: family 16 glycosylhydrolase [Bacteroidales bacterium]|nr:family 16 glycosylhydrolase [Bacteroidales bacterium]
MAILTLTCSCGEDAKDPDDSGSKKGTVTISTDAISVSYKSTTETLTIQADCDWGIAAEDKTWCSVSPSGGGKGTATVQVKISENNSELDRSTNLVVRYGTEKKSIAVSQHYKVDAVNISDEGFLKALLAGYDADKDGILSTVEAAKVKEIKASGYGIKSMSELTTLFDKITSLDCSKNNLTELNISTLYDLKTLDCTGNPNLKKIYVWSGFNAPEGFSKPAEAEYVEPEINTPFGYHLVWQDEFNEGTVPSTKNWTHEVKNAGWVNNELQNYVSGKSPKGTRVTEIVDGKLHINCFKEDGKIYSGRIYGNVNTGWKYGYVEASICLPSGKGTWPAFWMMPVHYTAWPDDGEIDIMEEVGYHKDYVSSSLHALGHVHSNNTQVTKEVYCKGAEGEYHTYGMEWTPDYFQFYVDGNKTLYYKNPGTGKVDWPYDAPFYVILNLAWGGSWGGAQGVNEAVLPVTMKVDYVRVFQK